MPRMARTPGGGVGASIGSSRRTSEYTMATSPRDRILAAVLDCIGSSGFDSVSMRAVAHRAGVPLGSLHYYFPSKEEMVGAALARSVEDIIGGIVAGVDETAAPRDRLRSLMIDAIPRLCADTALVTVYICFWRLL